MDKYTAIFLMCIVISTVLGISVEEYSKRDHEVQMAKAGLEECPQEPGSYANTKTIWVESCDDYLKSRENIKK